MGLAGSCWLPGIANFTDGRGTFLRILGVSGVLVGTAVAGLVNRHNLLKDNASFEGMVLALANVWISIFISSPFSRWVCTLGRVWFDGIDRRGAGIHAIYQEDRIILM